MNDFINELKGFLDKDLMLKLWPSKPDKKQAAIEYLASKFESGKIYSEKEVSEIIKANHTFNDHPMLRREQVDRRLLARTTNGSEYWKVV